jgi:DNA (cytosine-5)-methyltransferase 1
LEKADYAFGAANLCAAGVGAPHARQRHYWVADSGSGGRRQLLQTDTAQKSLSSSEWKEGSFWMRSGGAPSRGRDERTRLCSPDVLLLADGFSPALDGYGNAIVPQVAAEFITAYREINGR